MTGKENAKFGNWPHASIQSRYVKKRLFGKKVFCRICSRLPMVRFFQYLLVQIVVSVIQVMPMSWCGSLCRGLAWLVCDKLKFRRKVIRENVLGVYPDASNERIEFLAREMWYHLFLMCCEIAQAPRKIHDTNWRKHVFIRDKVRMTSYLIDYRPLIAVSGHFGNFEMAGYVTGLLGMPSYTVARKLDNDYLDRFLNAFRERNGQFILPKDGSAPMVQKVLEAGGILTILGDQHAGTKGCWIDFLGRPAACHKAIALFTISGYPPGQRADDGQLLQAHRQATPF